MFEKYMAWSILIGLGYYLFVCRVWHSQSRQNLGDTEHKIPERTQQLERSYDMTLEALGDTLCLKTTRSKDQSKRVTAFTIAIAKVLGLSKEEIKVIARGAFMHNIVKLGVPDAILNKSGHLSDRDKEIIRNCRQSYQALMKIPFMQEAANIIRSHEEHFDGSGYPRGLKGEEIPLGARIIAVAVSLDNITSDHDGHAAQSVQAARDEIDDCSGRQFDPKVVETFLSIPENFWEDLRKETDSPPS
jgi:cyclic di-GMP phosphodiesterase